MKVVLRVKGVSRKIEGPFELVLWGYQGYLKDVQKVGCVSRKFKMGLKEGPKGI